MKVCDFGDSFCLPEAQAGFSRLTQFQNVAFS